MPLQPLMRAALAVAICTSSPVAADVPVELATEEIIANRKAIAKELSSGGITAALISVRLAQGLAGGDTEALEVTVRDAGGEPRLVDRLNMSNGQSALLTAQNGDAVGLLKYRTTTEGSVKSARVEIVVYLANGQTLLKRVGEFQCQKSASEGTPDLKILSAVWQGNVRQLLVSVQATCGVIQFYGARQRELLNLTGLPFETALKTYPTTEYSAQIAVSFDEEGNLISAGRQTEENQVERACVETARKTGEYSVCGAEYVSAVWPDGKGRVQTGRECSPVYLDFVHGKNFTILACDETGEGEAGETASSKSLVEFELRTRGSLKAAVFELECSCKVMEIGRLAFSESTRTLTFNVETDAAGLSFEGRPLQVRTATAGSHIDVPILRVDFNSDWQITRAGWLDQETTQQSSNPQNATTSAPDTT